MLSTRIVCPHCSTGLRGGTDLLGRRVKCQKCGQKFIAGSPNATPLPATGEFPPAPSTMEMAAVDAFVPPAPRKRSGIQVAAPFAPPAPGLPAANQFGQPGSEFMPTAAAFAPSTGTSGRRGTGLVLVLAGGLVLLLGGGALGMYLLNNPPAIEQAKVSPKDQLVILVDSLPPSGGVTNTKDENPPVVPIDKKVAETKPTKPGAGEEPKTPGLPGAGSSDPKTSEPAKPRPPQTTPPDKKDPDTTGKNPFIDPALILPGKKPKTGAGDEEYHTVLSEQNQNKVNDAIEKGMRWLKKTQLATGTWPTSSPQGGHAPPVGYSALPALTLLECGVPKDDPVIQKAAAFVRQHVLNLGKGQETYELSLAILFLDKLGEKKDQNLIRKLAARLIAGQNGDGGWTYTCPSLNNQEETELVVFLHATRPDPYFITGNGGNNNFVPITKEMLDKELFLIPGGKNDPSVIPVSGNPSDPPVVPINGGNPTKPDDKNGKGILLPFPDGDPNKGLVLGDKPGTGANKPGTNPKPSGPVEAIFKPYDIKKLVPTVQKLPIVQTNPLLKIANRKTALKGGNSDNSNTQFAMMALWVARKHNVPIEKTMALVDQRFLSSQRPDGGWGYHSGGGGTPSMICVGLIGLAVGQGSHKESLGLAWKLANTKGVKEDPSIQFGVTALGKHIGQAPADWKQGVPLGDLYFLWSVERVAMLYNLKTIGGKEWYNWAAHQLVVNQKGEGYWSNGHHYHGTSPTIDTCLALLILKRANFVPDLTESLKEFIPITK